MSNLTAWQNAIKQSFPKFQAINPERAKTELGFALQLFQNNPQLQKCDADSIINSVVNVARTSITLNPVLRLAYLVPRGNKCILDFSYMGMVSLLKDNGCIKTINAQIVYADEEFDFNGFDIRHKPVFAPTETEHNNREIIGCYSRAVLPSNDVVFEFMPFWEIDKVRKSSTNSSSKFSAWNSWRDEMVKKTVIKRHFKMLINTGSNINNDKISALMEVENQNNPLKNEFSKSQNIKTAFIDETTVEEKSEVLLESIISDPVTPKKETTKAKKPKKEVKLPTGQSDDISDAEELAIKERERDEMEKYQEQQGKLL